MVLITISVLTIIIISSLHEEVKKFLLYNATLSSSTLVEHLFVVVKIDWLNILR